MYSRKRMKGFVFFRKDVSAHQESTSILELSVMDNYHRVGFTILHRRELPREAFLGEMVVGHKNSKVIKTLSHEQIMRRFAKIADIVGKTCVNCVQSILNMFYFR